MTAPTASRRKYHNQPVEVNGITFDSRREAARYMGLYVAEQQGLISALQVHPSWPLVVNETRVGRYTADFCYVEGGAVVVEDVKSKPTRTRDYVLRKKLMKALYGIDIREIT